MSCFARWALPALVATLPLTAAAQEASATEDRAPAREAPFRIGIGASVDVANVNLTGSRELTFLPVGFSNVHVPIWIGALRIEPEFGYTSSSHEESYSLDGDSESYRFDTSAFRIGTGVAWSFAVAEDTRIYVGPKFGLIFRSTEEEEGFHFGEISEKETVEISSTDFWIGASLGGEAFLTRNFSLGVEAQINYISLGEPDVEIDPEPEGEQPKFNEEGSLLSTHALFMARVYFN